MRTISLYIYVVFNLIGTLFFKAKYNSMIKKGHQKEADDMAKIVVMNWAKGILKKAEVNIDASGLQNIPNEACCFISNHQGNFDIIAMLAVIDKNIGFIAKKEMEKLPIVSGWMRAIKCVFMDRSNVRESLKAINQGADNLKNGQSMVIFPEGTRSKNRNVGEFKKGSLKMATKAKVPIIPITLDGSYKIFEENNGSLRKGEIKVIVGKPIYLDNLSKEEQKDLVNIVRDEVIKNLQIK